VVYKFVSVLLHLAMRRNRTKASTFVELVMKAASPTPVSGCLYSVSNTVFCYTPSENLIVAMSIYSLNFTTLAAIIKLLTIFNAAGIMLIHSMRMKKLRGVTSDHAAVFRLDAGF